MMRWLLFFALIAIPARAELPQRSLFFPSGAAPAAIATTAPIASGGDTVNNFIYVAPAQWSFWWHGQRVAAGAVPPGITVTAVTAARVEFNENGHEYAFDVGKFAPAAPAR